MVKRQDNHRFVDCLRKYPITYSSVFSASFKRTSSKNCVVFVTQTSGNRKSAPRSERRKGKASFLRSAGPGCRHSPCSGVRSSSGRSRLLTGNWHVQSVNAWVSTESLGEGATVSILAAIESWRENAVLETDKCSRSEPKTYGWAKAEAPFTDSWIHYNMTLKLTWAGYFSLTPRHLWHVPKN